VAALSSKSSRGWVSELDKTNLRIAALKYAQLQELRKTAGPPWRSQRIPKAEALARISDYDTPTAQLVKKAQGMSIPELIQASLQAIAMRQEAIKKGEWAPPPGHPAAVAHALGAYSAPGQGPLTPHDLLAADAGLPAPKRKPAKVPVQPSREDVGGERVLAGQAALARQIAPTNPGVPVPITSAQLARGDVAPGGA